VDTVFTANQAQDHMGGGWLDQGILEELNMDIVQTIDSNTASSSAMTWAAPTSANSSWITDLGLSLAVLEHLLDGFRSLVRYFPFVIIPADWTVTYMAENRPFLLLSAVACASSRFGNLQQALAEELKETLSHRVVIAGEKDLDLLQGLLVHLAWFVLCSCSIPLQD
jgi:1,2-phenylacetyl-CoA epoxidase catalytic subunit